MTSSFHQWIKQQSPLTVSVLWTICAIIYCAILLWIGGTLTDEFLIFLTGGVFYCAVIHPRRVYFWIALIDTVIATVVLYLSAHYQSSSMNTLFFISVSALFLGEMVFRISDARRKAIRAMRETNAKLEETNRHLQQALLEVRTLSNLLPVCSSCRKIQTEDGHWTELESYVKDRVNVQFNHGVCPECAKSLNSDHYDKFGFRSEISSS